MVHLSKYLYISVFCFIALCTGAITISCTDNARSAIYPSNDFYSGNYKLILYFDLRNDTQPQAGITVNNTGVQSPAPHLLVLPFESTNFQQNQSILSTAGSYKGMTVINYIFFQANTGQTAIGFEPRFDPTPSGPFSTEDLRGNLYFIRTGLERRFIYKYPKSGASDHWPPELQNIPRDTIDAIGVAIPTDAIGKEIRRGKTEIPDRLSEDGNVRFYPASSAQSASLELRYDLPPTSEQKVILEYGVKLIAVILIPLLELLLLSSSEIMNPRLRRLALIGGALLELVVLIIVWQVAVTVKGESGWKTVLDLIVVGIGAVLMVIALLVKRKPKSTQTEPSST